MKMIKLISPMLLLTLVMFLVNGFAGGLPKHAITRIDTGKGPVNAIAYAQSINQLAIAAANNIHIHGCGYLQRTDGTCRTYGFGAGSHLFCKRQTDRKWQRGTRRCGYGKRRRGNSDGPGMNTLPLLILSPFLWREKSFGVQVAKTTCFGRGTRVMAAVGVPKPPQQI